jgi:peptidoglycan/LPS O-acetylase OafA/YrhL
MKLTYRPEIDGLRAIAVGAVILYHAQINILGHQPFKGGFIGVDIFFVISGYLITSIILKELVTTGSFSFKHFYERRIRRILPALLFVMLVSLPIAWKILLPSSIMDFSKSIFYSLGFVSNFYFHYSGQIYGSTDGLLKPFLHTWSLSVEEQYYILFPIVLLITFKYFRIYLIHTLVFGLIISLGIAEWTSRNYPSISFYFLHTRMWELLAGSILAYFEITKGHRSKNQLLNITLPTIGLMLISHSIIFFDNNIFHPSFFTLSPVVGVCLIIWFSHKDELVNKILSTKLFVGIGLISYSLYLWHYPIFSFYRNLYFFFPSSLNSKIFIALLLFVTSFLSYKFIESPFRNIKIINFNLIIKLIFFIYLLLILFFVFVINLNGLPNRFIPILNNYYSNKNEIKKVNFNKNIYLIGDSHAGRLFNSLQNKISNNKYNLRILNTPFFENHKLISVKTGKENEPQTISTLKANEELSEIIKDSNNQIFIFHARYPLYFSGGKYFNNDEGGQEDYGSGIYSDFYISKELNNFKEKNKVLIEQFISSLEKISEKNFVILVYPVPEVGFLPPFKIFINYLLNKDIFIKDLENKEYVFTTSHEVYLKRNFDTFRAFDLLKNKNIYKVYPQNFFCNNFVKDRCIVHNKEEIYYDDYNHLSIKGSEIVSEIIYEKIIEILNKRSPVNISKDEPLKPIILKNLY